MIDLRSDTITQPTDAMREAMARAPVGDDVYGEDPTVNRLQEAAAAVLGKEAALFVPTGSMGNLIAVKCHTQPGDEVLIDRFSHIVQFEMSGITWFSGAMPRTLDGRRGILDPAEVQASIRTEGPYYSARTTLVCVENTHNYGSGSVYPLETLRAVRAAADHHGVPVHMDGARLFNAAVALGVSPATIAAHTDTVMCCFSKGLSAPVGSILCGTRAFIEKARGVRKVVGGGMRQCGVIAAAAHVALDTMVERLAEDHAHARDLARGLVEIDGVSLDPESVQTNIVVFRLRGGAPACLSLVTRLRDREILAGQLTPDTVRFVTHRHITAADVVTTLSTVQELLREQTPTPP